MLFENGYYETTAKSNNGFCEIEGEQAENAIRSCNIRKTRIINSTITVKVLNYSLLTSRGLVRFITKKNGKKITSKITFHADTISNSEEKILNRWNDALFRGIRVRFVRNRIFTSTQRSNFYPHTPDLNGNKTNPLVRCEFARFRHVVYGNRVGYSVNLGYKACKTEGMRGRGESTKPR